MKVSAVVTKNEFVEVRPKDVITELRREWLKKINCTTLVLKKDSWYRDESVDYGHYDIEKFTLVREATQEEIQIHQAFETLRSFYNE